MDLSPEERQALDDLREVAGRYCAEIEAASQRTPIEFLRRMNQLLPELYWRASLLPPESASEEGDEDSDVQQDSATFENRPHALSAGPVSEFATMQQLQTLVGPLDAYHMVFDPFGDESAITYVLSDDLASIYAAVREQLDFDSPGADDTKRPWDWRFVFTSHWGTDLIPSALPPLPR